MENTTNSSISDDAEKRTFAVTAIYATFLILIMFVALIGNIAVVTVIFYFRSLRKEISNVLIINLSLTDLSNVFLVMSSTLVSLIYDGWPLGNVWCDIVCALNYCLIIVSMLTLCLISLDRHQAVVYPFTYPSRVTRPRLYVLIGYAWFQGIVFASVPSLYQWVEYDYWEAICAIQWHKERERAIYYVVTAFALCFLGPGMVLVYCYVKILKEAKKQKAQIVAIPKSNGQEHRRRKFDQNTRIVWSLLVVVLAYFACTTPFSLTKLIKVSANEENFVHGHVNLVSSMVAFIASAINPLIYGIFRKDFREAYSRILQMCFLGKKRGSTLENHVNTLTLNSQDNSLNQHTPKNKIGITEIDRTVESGTGNLNQDASQDPQSVVMTTTENNHLLQNTWIIYESSV